MYSGHILYLCGVVVLTSSPLALVFTLGALPWYSARVREDEEQLARLFGADYERYCSEVSRWGLDFRRVISHGARGSH
jgi:protein-S-isoprenylcysteine O-methyltransferase Ste14